MSNYEAGKCKNWADASTQALRTYYQQVGASLFNLNETLDALVTITNRSQKTVHSEQQKKFTELSNRPTLALYMGFSDQLIPNDVKNQRVQPFMPPPREQSQSRPNPGGSKESEKQFSVTQKETHSGLQGTPQQKGESKCTENEEDTTIVESLMFFNLLCDLEQNLPNVFNKLNNTEYTSGVVNLSKYSLTNSEKKCLVQRAGFLPHSRGSRHWQFNPRSG